MIPYIGDFAEDETLYHYFNTFDSNDPSASVTITNLASTDLYVHKDGVDSTETTTGATVDIDFDTQTGIHKVTVDTSADAFYATGSDYMVRMEGTTVDGATINAGLFTFSIENRFNDVNVATWLGTAVTSGTGGPDVNVNAISDDTTAAVNLEAMYDGTGYTDDTGPASRSQLDALTVTGAAVNVGARAAPNGFVMTTGTETTNDEDATQALDGTRHVLDEDGTTLDCYYKFDIGGDGIPTSVTITGVFNGGNDDFGIFANAGTDASPTWQQVGTLEGTNSSNNVAHTFTLLAGQIVSDITGEVQIRVYSTSLTGSSFDVDQIIVSKAVVNRSVGYAGGTIWVDTANGIAGTENYVNGTADKPVLTWANALTLATQLTMNRFHIVPGSAIALTASAADYEIVGANYTLDLSDESIADAYIKGATISGAGTGTGAHIDSCSIGTVSLAGGSLMCCALTDTLTLTGATTYLLDGCYSGVAGSGSPTIDFGAAVGNTALNMRHYSGGITIDNKDGTGTDTMSLEGNGQLVVSASSSGAISMRGNFRVTNTGGATITTDDNTANTAAILVDTADIQPNYATSAALATVDGIVDTILVDTADMQPRVAAIEIDTGTTLDGKIDTIDGNVDSILVDTGTTIPATLGTPADTDMSTDIANVDTDTTALLALLDDARTEPGQGAPPVNPDLATKIDYLYKAWRNRSTQTATTYTLYADNTTTADQAATVSDDGTTADKGEVGTGA